MEIDAFVSRDSLPSYSDDFVETNLMYAKTYCGFSSDEVVSAFQKAIRRGFTDDAIQWGLDLYFSGSKLRSNVWNRIVIISIEDIGIADINAILFVSEKYYKYRKDKKSIKDVTKILQKISIQKGLDVISDKLSLDEITILQHVIDFVTCIVYLSKAKKTRINDDAVISHNKNLVIEYTKDRSIEELYKNLLHFYQQRDLMSILFYRIALHNKEGTLPSKEINGKIPSRQTVPVQALLWSDDIINTEYLRNVKDIALSESFRWKDASQLFETHVIMCKLLHLDTNESALRANDLSDKRGINESLINSIMKIVKRESLRGIPDYAKDKHTKSGIKLKRGIKHFFTEAAQLNNKDQVYKQLATFLYNNEIKILTEIGKFKD